MAAADSVIGFVNILDSGTARYGGRIVYQSTTTAEAQVDNVAGTYITPNNITASAPMVWTTSDSLLTYFSYEAA